MEGHSIDPLFRCLGCGGSLIKVHRSSFDPHWHCTKSGQWYEMKKQPVSTWQKFKHALLLLKERLFK